MREALGSQRYADLAFHFAAWVAREGWTEEADADIRARQQAGIAEFAANVLDRRYRKARKLGKRFKRLSVDERHQVRIALKKLRYGIDFFADLFPGKRFERFRKATTRMQERLGHLNDVAVAGRLADNLVNPLGPDAKGKPASGGGQIVGWYTHQVSGLELETVEAWQAFKALKPFWSRAR